MSKWIDFAYSRFTDILLGAPRFSLCSEEWTACLVYFEGYEIIIAGKCEEEDSRNQPRDAREKIISMGRISWQL